MAHSLIMGTTRSIMYSRSRTSSTIIWRAGVSLQFAWPHADTRPRREAEGELSTGLLRRCVLYLRGPRSMGVATVARSCAAAQSTWNAVCATVCALARGARRHFEAAATTMGCTIIPL